MAEPMQTVEAIPAPRLWVDWKAIWAGVFTFVAIWAVFGSLGWAIFASAANPNTARPITGMSVGMAIWAIVLTAIAMYVAGRETGRLAMIGNRHDGAIHGMIMFGLSTIGVLLLIALGGDRILMSNGAASAHNPYLLSVLAGLGWAGFLSLFVGWLAAMGGASTGAQRRQTETVVQPIRNAA